jgi:GNAT superfamily N-acetyltransferase
MTEPSVEIREATVAEVERLLPLYEWLLTPPGYTPRWWKPQRARGALRDAIENAQSTILVAESEGELLGICSAYLDLNSVRFGRRCWVEDLAVHPERRSAGIGGRLLDEAEAWARARGATHLELDTGIAREEAQRFYERRGEPQKGISYSWPL